MQARRGEFPHLVDAQRGRLASQRSAAALAVPGPQTARHFGNPDAERHNRVGAETDHDRITSVTARYFAHNADSARWQGGLRLGAARVAEAWSGVWPCGLAIDRAGSVAGSITACRGHELIGAGGGGRAAQGVPC